jgi:hypothetical protein
MSPSRQSEIASRIRLGRQLDSAWISSNDEIMGQYRLPSTRARSSFETSRLRESLRRGGTF